MIKKITCLISILTIASVQGACSQKASVLGETVWNQLDRILSVSYADKVIYQTDIPYTITQSGVYGVGENLSIVGTATAITVAPGVSAVVIDLHEHTISASGGSDTAISASNNVIVQNGTIKGFNIGVYGGYLVKHMVIEQCTIGVSQSSYIYYTDGIDCATFYQINNVIFPGRLLKCNIFNSSNYGVVISNSIYVPIDRCSFYGGNGGIDVAGSRAPIVMGCSFSNIAGNAININGAMSTTTTTIRDCTIIGCTNGMVLLNTLTPIIVNSKILNCPGVAINLAPNLVAGTVRSNIIANAAVGIQVVPDQIY